MNILLKHSTGAGLGGKKGGISSNYGSTNANQFCCLFDSFASNSKGQ